MDPKKRKRRRFLILALLAVGVIAATSAYAYWTTSGTGGGTAQIANPTGINVTQTTVVNGLYPGASVPIAGTFTNSNTSDLVVTSLTATATAGASCDATNFTVTGSLAGSPVTVPGSGSAPWSGLTLNMVNKPTTNQDACKNLPVTITYTAA